MQVRLFRKRHTKVSAIPGMLVILREAPAPKSTSIHYNETEYRVVSVDSSDDLNDAFNETEVTCSDIQDFGD